MQTIIAVMKQAFLVDVVLRFFSLKLMAHAGYDSMVRPYSTILTNLRFFSN